MTALFVGHSYIDMTMVTDVMPSGDEKMVAHDFAVSFGGNAVTAAFACAKLGRRPGPAHNDGGRLARPDVLGDGA